MSSKIRQIKLVLTSLVFTVLMLIASAHPAQALPLFNPDTSHYYEAIAGQLDWEMARINALNFSYLGLQGHLVTITSHEENSWIWNNLDQPVRYYLGASDAETEGVWKWVTGETWDYSNWNWKEPNEGFGDYPEDALSYWDDAEWNDLPILHDYWNDGIPYMHGYIVEYEAAAVPEPATFALIGSGLIGAFLRRRKSA